MPKQPQFPPSLFKAPFSPPLSFSLPSSGLCPAIPILLQVWHGILATLHQSPAEQKGNSTRVKSFAGGFLHLYPSVPRIFFTAMLLALEDQQQHSER